MPDAVQCPVPQTRSATLRTPAFLARGSAVAVAVFAIVHAIAADKLNFPPDRAFDMQHIKLVLAVDVEKKHVDGVATLRMTTTRESPVVQLDAVDLDVKVVKAGVANAPPDEVRFANTGKSIEVYLPKTPAVGDAVTVVIEYALQDPKNGLHFFGPSANTPDAPYQVWSQGESEENRFWFPCFDHPSDMQTTELIATVDSRFTVISNGKLLGSKALTDKKGKTVYYWTQDKPHVVYLVTLVVGEFASKTVEWRGKPVSYYVPKDREADIDRSFANTPKMLDFFSDKIGVEYAWDKYAQVCCHEFGGGMENTSATTLGEHTLHDERSHIDGDSEGLVAHELAHQWFGDLLTCRDWAHIWLNEGFASYFEALWDEELNGADEFAYNMWGKAQAAISGGKQFPIVHRGYTDPDQQFDSRAYPKGAWVLHMLRRRHGDELFWKGINLYVTKHKHQNVETVDLRRAFEQATGRPLERFFYDWTERPGNPILNVTMTWNEEQRAAEVTVKQTQEAEAFIFPLVLEFRVEGGDAPVTVTRMMDSKDLTVFAPLPARPTMFRVDPGNTVLKELTEEKSRDLWIAQLADDPDPIGRIRAAQSLGKNKSDANREALAKALRDEKFWGVRVEVANILAEMQGDIARDALLAGLKDADPRPRKACAEGLGRFNKDEKARAAIEALVSAGDQSYRVESAAIAAFAKLAPDDAKATLIKALDRPSDREVIRCAAISAIGEQNDPSVVPILLDWCGMGKPMDCRQEAYGALGNAANRIALDEATMTKVIDVLSNAAANEVRRPRAASIRALGALGKRAAPALPTLRRVAAGDPNERAVAAAKEAIEKIEKDAPSQQQIRELTKRVEELQKENQSLKERVTSVEARTAATSQPAKTTAEK